MTVRSCLNITKSYSECLPVIQQTTSISEFDAEWEKHNGEKALSITNCYGMHAMILAAQVNNTIVICHIYQKARTVLDLADGDGWTPLFHAVYFRQLQAANTLIELGADLNTTTIKNYQNPMMAVVIPQGATCLWAAAKVNNLAMTELLLKFGAIPHPELDAESDLVIHWAKNAIAMESARLLKELDLTLRLPFVLSQTITEFLFPVYSPSIGNISQGNPDKKRKRQSLTD